MAVHDLMLAAAPAHLGFDPHHSSASKVSSEAAAAMARYSNQQQQHHPRDDYLDSQQPPSKRVRADNTDHHDLFLSPYDDHHQEESISVAGGRASHGHHTSTSKSNGNSTSTSNTQQQQQPVRRRISRACDQCNQLRTKCDGQHPCTHCVEFGLGCEYARARKKRGKASKKDLAARQQQAAAEKADGGGGEAERKGSSEAESVAEEEIAVGLGGSPPPPRGNGKAGLVGKGGQEMQGAKRKREVREGRNDNNHLNIKQHASTSAATGTDADGIGLDASIGSEMSQFDGGVGGGDVGPGMNGNGPTSIHLSGFDAHADDFHRAILQQQQQQQQQGHDGGLRQSSSAGMPPHQQIPHGSDGGTFSDHHYSMPSPPSQHGFASQQFAFGNSPLGNFLGHSPNAGAGGTPNWMAMPSPSAAALMFPALQPITSVDQTALRYPVLRPILPYLAGILPVPIACDLLELYFKSTSSTFLHPVSPYVTGYVFRKWSFLRPHNPRPCSPALLASMLWLAAQTSEVAYLNTPVTARARVCQQLLELTISLLRPLVHAPGGSSSTAAASSASAAAAASGHGTDGGIAIGGFGVAAQHGQPRELVGAGSPGATAGLDDIATYIHLATVVSASEYKAASLRWWHVAWSLARELKLGRELPPNPDPADVDPSPDLANGGSASAAGHAAAEYWSAEQREERRRVWWLLYCVDRHLALCYNRPMHLVDAECQDLYQPEDDGRWQAGEYYAPDHGGPAPAWHLRRRGPGFECTGHSIFGFFLPLMTILGEIVDLHHARNHPRFGPYFRATAEAEGLVGEITSHLDVYERSLAAFEAQHTADDHPEGGSNGGGDASSHPAPTAAASTALQTQIVIAYGTHLLHTLHILLNGKWDPLALLDNEDHWIATTDFLRASDHAVGAAAALDALLDHDPDLSFMPWFFGIYLLQGSFLLLLIADKLAAHARADVVKACETIVRAHEACIVTLNTEYQRNFRKVMRSALAQVRGRMVEDFGEAQLKRREVLALYRWTGDGTGLAL